MRLPYEIEKKLRKFCVSGLMNYIVAATAVVYVVMLAMPQWNLGGRLALVRGAVIEGEVWRLLTFVIVPGTTDPLYLLLSLYFYWMLGTQLENRWGTVKFNLYYWIGILGAIAAMFITGYGTNSFLNLSLFFAFAILYPDVEFRLFFLIPVKAKYLALLDAVLYVVMFVQGDWSARVAILFSLANLLLFLGGDLINWVRRDARYWKTRRNFRKNMR